MPNRERAIKNASIFSSFLLGDDSLFPQNELAKQKKLDLIFAFQFPLRIL